MVGQKKLKNRFKKDILFKGAVYTITGICAIPLVLILYYISKQGITAINWSFLTSIPKPVGESGGGILNAISGSFLLIIIATILSVPLGIICGIYISENSKGKIASFARLSAEILQGTPSIVFGVIAYVWIVRSFGRFSALSGGVALALIMLPIIVTTAENTFNLIPKSYKEAALALGVPYHKVIRKVILPCSLSGIVAGITLSIARIAGETAPLLFTAFGNPYVNKNILEPVGSLPVLIYHYATSPYKNWQQQAWGAAFILIIFILIVNITAKLIVHKWKVQL